MGVGASGWRIWLGEEGVVDEIWRTRYKVYDVGGAVGEGEIIESDVEHDAGDKGGYRHYMLKEIHEQPSVIRNTLQGRLGETGISPNIFGQGADAILADI